MAEEITLYARSFRWGFHGTETEENRAALITTLGWCSGWRPLLSVLGMNT